MRIYLDYRSAEAVIKAADAQRAAERREEDVFAAGRGVRERALKITVKAPTTAGL